MMQIPKRQPTTRKEQIAAWRENIPEKYRGTYDKAMAGKSRQKAIFAKCQDCMCWQTGEVRRCEVVTCPLHPYRPGKGHSAQIDALGSVKQEEDIETEESGAGKQE